MKSHLFIFSFMSPAVGDISVKILLYGISEIFLPMFYFMTFMVSGPVFESFIHLEFIFVYDVSWWSSFIFLHVAVHILQHLWWKGYFYSILCFFPLCQILIDVETWVYFWALYSVPLVYVSIILPEPGYFDYSGLVI